MIMAVRGGPGAQPQDIDQQPPRVRGGPNNRRVGQRNHCWLLVSTSWTDLTDPVLT